jgi:hypothetical protein
MDSVSDKYPGVPDWTDALQAKRVDPTEASRAALLKIFGGDEARLESFAESMTAEWVEVPQAEYAALQERVAELERREALLTAFVGAYDDWASTLYHWEECMAARVSLAEAGFPWTEEPQP